MKLEKVALIAEIISSVAIVVTLIVLLIEVRGNTAAIHAATYQNVVDSITTPLYARGTDPDTARIWEAGSAGERLEPLDQTRYFNLVGANMRRFENAFYQYQIGGIEESQWQPIENIISSLMSSPGHMVWWSDSRGVYSAEFQNLIDSVASSEE